MRHLILIACLLFSACGGEDEPFCPDGSEQVEEHDGIAHARWCEVDGVRDGPYENWRDDVGLIHSGHYASGEQCGAWEDCHYRVVDKTWNCETREHDPC
jgi:hypothetical protein